MTLRYEFMFTTSSIGNMTVSSLLLAICVSLHLWYDSNVIFIHLSRVMRFSLPDAELLTVTGPENKTNRKYENVVDSCPTSRTATALPYQYPSHHALVPPTTSPSGQPMSRRRSSR